MSVVGLTMGTACSGDSPVAPEAVPPPIERGTSTTAAADVEFYDRFGKVRWHLDTASSLMIVARAAASSPKAEEMRAVLRAARDSARKYDTKHAGSMEIQLKVLDALSSTTGAAFHKRIAALPITQVRKETASATAGVKLVQIDFVWHGRKVAKMTYDERATKTPMTSEKSSNSLAAQQDKKLYEYPCYEHCGGGAEDDPDGEQYATSQDIADAVAAVALMDAEVEALLPTVEMTAYGISPSMKSGTTTLAAYVSSPGSEFALMPPASEHPMEKSGCARERGLAAVAVTAFSGSWWRVALAAVALDPEPVTKVTLGFALAVAAASYVAVGYAVYNLDECQNP